MIDRVPFKDTKLSRLGLGAMRLPVKTKIKREANPLIDYKEAQKLVDYAIENGINYFDTAYMYHVGKSEKFIGTALAKGGNKVVLIDTDIGLRNLDLLLGLENRIVYTIVDEADVDEESFKLTKDAILAKIHDGDTVKIDAGAAQTVIGDIALPESNEKVIIS